MNTILIFEDEDLFAYLYKLLEIGMGMTSC